QAAASVAATPAAEETSAAGDGEGEGTGEGSAAGLTAGGDGRTAWPPPQAASASTSAGPRSRAGSSSLPRVGPRQFRVAGLERPAIAEPEPGSDLLDAIDGPLHLREQPEVEGVERDVAALEAPALAVLVVDDRDLVPEQAQRLAHRLPVVDDDLGLVPDLDPALVAGR